jgi:hypothetical protein
MSMPTSRDIGRLVKLVSQPLSYKNKKAAAPYVGHIGYLVGMLEPDEAIVQFPIGPKLEIWVERLEVVYVDSH